jgi:hypothetical protein
MTTVETNIGTDLIRIELQRVLETVYARQPCQLGGSISIDRGARDERLG